jgi:tetratricopeptide (TPR) repeat protein
MGSGELEQVRTHTEAGFALANKVRDRWSLASAGFDNARLAVYEGDWQTARHMSEVGSKAQPRDPRALAMRALVEYEVGDFDAGAAYVDQLQEVSESVPAPGPIAEHVFLAGAISLTARIADTDERLESAAASAGTLLSLPRLAPALAMVARTASALIAVQRKDVEAAERHYRAIEPQKGSACFIIPITFDRLLGLLAATFGQIDAALAHFSDGLAFCDRAGYRPEYASTASDYADVLLQRPSADDYARAIALQDEALGIAREFGMRPLVERVLARQQILNT